MTELESALTRTDGLNAGCVIGTYEHEAVVLAKAYRAQQARIAALEAVVKQCEWNMCVCDDACPKCANDDMSEQCQICLAHKHDGHKSDCELAAALDKAGEK